MSDTERVQPQDASLIGDEGHPDQRDYMATNLLAHIDKLPKTGDWWWELKTWAERSSTGKLTANDDPASTEHPERRRWTMWVCRDCGWVGNRPVIEDDFQEGWEQPWTRYGCPECSEVLEQVTVEEVPSGDVQGLVEVTKRLLGLLEKLEGHNANAGIGEPFILAPREAQRLHEARTELAKWGTASSGEVKDAG